MLQVLRGVGRSHSITSSRFLLHHNLAKMYVLGQNHNFGVLVIGGISLYYFFLFLWSLTAISNYNSRILENSDSITTLKDRNNSASKHSPSHSYFNEAVQSSKQSISKQIFAILLTLVMIIIAYFMIIA